MWNLRSNGGRREGEGLVAIAIDRDKGSQYALKWAVDHVTTRGQTMRLVHVNQRTTILPPPGSNNLPIRREPDNQTMDLFLPFRCFCMRRQVECEVVALEDPDIAKALAEYAFRYGIETLLLGAGARNGFSRLFKTADIPSSVAKLAPDFCNVYVISKGKITNIRAASCPVPFITLSQRIPFEPHNLNDDAQSVRFTLSRSRSSNNAMHDELLAPDNDISFASFDRPSTDSTFLSFYENLGSEFTRGPSKSLNMEHSNFEPLTTRSMSFDLKSLQKSSSIILQESARTSWLSQTMEDMEDNIRMLELELKETMDMYHAACEEALAAKQKATELQQWKKEEEERLEEAQQAKEAALAIAEEEKAKCKAAIEAAEAAQRIAKQESQKSVNAEMKAIKEAEEKKKLLDALGQSNMVLRYHNIFHILALSFLIIFSFFSKLK